jgi:uncharacterized membrane protein YuzA (DUF378 family)
MKAIRFLTLLLMVIGSLNLGLIGFFQYDLLGDVVGGMMSFGLLRVLYALIGLAGLLGLVRLVKCVTGCKCGSGCSCGCKKGR